MKPRETNAPSVANSLQSASEKLNDIITHSFSSYATKMIWDEKGVVTPIEESDPKSIQLSKHCLLALQAAEKIALGTSKVRDRYQQGGITSVIMGEMGMQGAGVYSAAQELSIHVQAIANMATEAGLSNKITTQLTSTIQLLSNASPKATLQDQFPNLSKTLSQVLATYFDANRPTAPIKPEQKYQSKKEIELIITNHTPLHYNQYSPNSYVLIKEASHPWMLVYLDEKHNSHLVNIDDMPQLRQILEPKSLAALTAKDSQAIKESLALRWNPSAQERGEWFILVEPLRSTMSGTQKLHELFKSFTDDALARGIELDPTQVDLIERTYQALQASTINSKGYYNYLLAGDQETPLSQSLKGIFNVIWAINELSKGYWENPGVAAHLQLIEHVKTALEDYWKIEWHQLDGNYRAISDQLINAMLVYGKDMAFAPLEKLAESTHDIELQHHLRFGVLLEKIRPLFDNLESVYQERNLGTLTNPFGYSEKMRKELEAKLSTAKEEEKAAEKASNTLHSIIEKLAWYKDISKDIAQPNLSGSRYETGALINTLEQTAQDLLLNILELKNTKRLSERQLAAMEALEDRLLADLTLVNKRMLLKEKQPNQPRDIHLDALQKKIRKSIGQNKEYLAAEENKGYLQRTRETISTFLKPSPPAPWPQAEIDLVMKTAGDFKKDTQRKSLNVAKFTEALAQHKKMQQEFAFRSLKSEGLIAFIEATKQSTMNNEMNVGKKRKLATILADIRGEDRAAYLTKKNAFKIAFEFATNPEQIKLFIQQVYALDTALGHALAIEATLANYTSDIPDFILQSNDPTILHQDLINALNRLEIKQILTLLPENPTNELSQRLLLFLNLFNAPTKNLQPLLSTPPSIHALPGGLNKDSFIKILVEQYTLRAKLLTQAAEKEPSKASSQPNREVMNKIGLLLGRLAHADASMAKTIFQNSEALTILKQECLLKESTNYIRPDRALYFEALVNTFSFNYAKGRHDEEDREFTVFFQANKQIVLEIHKALHPDDTSLNDTEILQLYTKDDGPKKLLMLLESFTKTCLSRDSDAELKLRQFFSAMLLCKDNYIIRNSLLELQRETHGSAQSRYLELLTTDASYSFWTQAKKDLPAKSKEFLSQLDADAQNLKKHIENSTISENEKANLNQKLELFITQKKDEVIKITERIPATDAAAAALPIARKKDIPLACRHAINEMDSIKKIVTKQQEEWTQEIQIRSTNRANLYILEEQLTKIETVLTLYLTARGPKTAALNSLFGYELQTKKRNLAIYYLTEFSTLKTDITHTDASYTDFAIKAIALSDQFEKKHAELVSTQNNGEKKTKKTGNLGKIITTTRQILFDQPIKDDLQKPLFNIARIVASIRSLLGKGTALFSKQPRNFEEKKPVLNSPSTVTPTTPATFGKK